jgi:uncharacterized membrane protein YkoI
MKPIHTKSSSILLAMGIALASVSGAAMAAKLDGAQYLKDAKVTLKQARATAMKTVHGKIVAEELEKESGGSGLRYSFDIKVHGAVHEVGVDAKTGKVLENSIEGDHPD